MPKKIEMKIELTEKEEALLHYEIFFGKNASVKKHARILYEAGRGAESLTELCKRADAGKAAVSRLMKKYTEYGVKAIYQCSRGKRRNHLDEIGEELEAYFDVKGRLFFAPNRQLSAGAYRDTTPITDD